MVSTSLLKRVEGFELWTTQSGSDQQFVVKTTGRRARVSSTIEAAEAFLAEQLSHARMARAH